MLLVAGAPRPRLALARGSSSLSDASSGLDPPTDSETRRVWTDPSLDRLDSTLKTLTTPPPPLRRLESFGLDARLSHTRPLVGPDDVGRDVVGRDVVGRDVVGRDVVGRDVVGSDALPLSP